MNATLFSVTGMNDSPGKTAAYCTYTTMIVATGKANENGQKEYQNTRYVYCT